MKLSKPDVIADCGDIGCGNCVYGQNVMCEIAALNMKYDNPIIMSVGGRGAKGSGE